MAGGAGWPVEVRLEFFLNWDLNALRLDALANSYYMDSQKGTPNSGKLPYIVFRISSQSQPCKGFGLDCGVLLARGYGLCTQPSLFPTKRRYFILEG